MISPFEIAIIALAFILFVGYRRLPKTGRAIGEAVAELRHAEERPQEDREP